MIRVFLSEQQDEKFYAKMGRYFASLDIAKELERQVYNKPHTTWYVFTLRQRVIGFASVYNGTTHFFLDNLYVLPEHRGQGIATDIVEEITQRHSNKPIRCIANNPHALKVFDRFGFVEVGQNGKYKKLVKH